MSDSSNRCRLREVDLSWTAITDCSLKLLGNAAKGSLTKVKARGCSFQGRKTVTNEGVCALAACGNLRVLKMYDYGHVTDAAILKLAECCADVTELSVPSCYSLTDEAVINAAGLWGDLSAIDISGILFISDASLKVGQRAVLGTLHLGKRALLGALHLGSWAFTSATVLAALELALTCVRCAPWPS
eukprot:2108271-Rhodomonas_salina.1